MLAAGLLVSIGGGAVAAADSDSAASTGAQPTDAPTQGSGTSGSTPSSETKPTALVDPTQGATDTDGTSAVPISSQPGATADPTSDPAAGDSELARDFISSFVEPTSAGSATSTPSTPSTPGPSPTAEPAVVASDSSVPAADSSVPAAESTVATSNSNVVAPVTTAVQQLADAVQPVTDAVTTASAPVGAAPPQALASHTPTMPIADAILKNMLSTVAGVVAPLVQTAGDLYELLGIPQATAPLIGEGGTAEFAVDHGAPLFGPQVVQWAAVIPAVAVNGPLFGTMTPPVTPDAVANTAALVQQLSLSGMASLSPEGIRPLDARSFLENVVTAVLVPASLTALAALALPGIGGLLVVSALGIRVGYRQAKAGLALRSSGIARFAATGPMGVVRSGSLVSLHTRKARVDRVARPEASQAVVRPLERVA